MIAQFFRNAGLMAAAELVARGKAFVIVPLLAHHFGALNYGAWAQVSVLVGIFGPLVAFGTDSAVVRFLPGRPLAEQRRAFSAWVLYLIGASVIVCGALLLAKGTIADWFFGARGEFETFIPLVAATLFVSFLFNSFRSWFRIHNDGKVSAAIIVVQALLGLGAVTLVLAFGYGVYELILLSVLADLLVVAWLFALSSKRYGWAAPDFSVIPGFLKFGLPIVPVAYAMWGLNWMDRFFLLEYGDLAEVGVYALLTSVGYLVIQVAVNPIWAMYPSSAAALYNAGDHATLQRLFERSAGLILALAVPAIAGLFVLEDHIISLLAPEEFVLGTPIAAIVGIGYLLLMLASYYDVALGLVHKQWLASVSIGVAALVNLGLNIVLIPRYGILGAAVATSIAFSAQFVFSLVMAEHYTKLRTRLLFPAKVLAASAAMGATVYGAAAITSGASGGWLAGMVAIGVGAYLLIALTFGIIPPELLRTVPAEIVPARWRRTP